MHPLTSNKKKRMLSERRKVGTYLVLFQGKIQQLLTFPFPLLSSTLSPIGP